MAPTLMSAPYEVMLVVFHILGREMMILANSRRHMYYGTRLSGAMHCHSLLDEGGIDYLLCGERRKN